MTHLSYTIILHFPGFNRGNPSQNNTIQIYLLLENSPEITTLVTNQVYLPVAGVERPGTVVATEEEKEDDNQN